jgi:hypothetical protein
MRRLRVRCDHCGEVTLPAGDIVVSTAAGHMSASFRCPCCGLHAEQGCDTEHGHMMLLNGARNDRAEAPPLGLSELVLLRELLDRPDFVDIMARPR